MSSTALPASCDVFTPTDALLQDVLAVSLTAVNLLRPVYGPSGELLDFVLDYLNPAAQRITGLPELPGGTLLNRLPNVVAADVFDYCRRAYQVGTGEHYDANFQADGRNFHFRLAARRSGERLVVSFTDNSDQDRNAAEAALRVAQDAEHAVHTEVTRQREALYSLLEQAPAMICVFKGPNHVFEFVNPPYQALVGKRALLGLPIAEAMPELAGQPIFELLDRVYRTGEPFHAHEMLVQLDHDNTGHALGQNYYNFVYQAMRTSAGTIDGILVFAYEVTVQVQARQQVQHLNRELEARVAARTQEAEAAAQRLRRVTDSLPSTTFTADESGRVLDISSQWYAYTGMAPDTSIDEAWPQLLHPDDLPAVARQYRAALADGLAWCYEFRLRGADGAYRWFASQGAPEPRAEAEAAGRPRQWFGSNLDIHDLKQAQHELEQQDRRLRELLQQSPAMIGATTGPDHRYVFTNPGYDALVGHRARLGAPVAECFPEIVAQGFIDLLDRVYRTGEPHEGHETPIEFQPPGGAPTAHYLDFTYQPLRDAQGRITGVQAFVLEVSERVRARQQNEALHAELLAAAHRRTQEREAQRRQMYALFLQAPAAIAILDGPAHVHELVNSAYQQMFPGRVLLGRPLAEVFPELAGTGIIETFHRVYESGQNNEEKGILIPFLNPDSGEVEDRYFNYVQQARYDEHGQPNEVLVFAFEITQQVRARQQAERSERRFRHLAESTPMIVWESDAQGQTTYLSPHWKQFTTATNGQGLGWQEYMHPEDQAPFLQAWLAAVASGEPFEAEMRLRLAATGEYRWHLDRAVPVRDANGRVLQWVGAAIDIHAQKLAEQGLQKVAHQLRDARDEAQGLNQQLLATNEQLTRTNVDLDNFIYTASHDLKASISNIEGLLHLLRAELPAELVAGAYVGPGLARMMDAVDRFKRTLDHLTEVSKLQKESAPTAEAVNLAALVDDVRLDLASLSDQVGACWHVTVQDAPPIQFSPKNLRSVVYNLLSNALKYHHPDRTPHVDVRAHVQAGYTVLEVHDNGLGISPTHLPKLFGMFQRFHDHVDGTGIGLYMIKRMIENAGGRIVVHSQLGAGTTVFVYLPLASSLGAAS